jgi:hypothetical protein
MTDPDTIQILDILRTTLTTGRVDPQKLLDWANTTPNPALTLITIAGIGITQWAESLRATKGTEEALAHIQRMELFNDLDNILGTHDD